MEHHLEVKHSETQIGEDAKVIVADGGTPIDGDDIG